jgi:hypothetical protein
MTRARGGCLDASSMATCNMMCGTRWRDGSNGCTRWALRTIGGWRRRLWITILDGDLLCDPYWVRERIVITAGFMGITL